MSSPLVPSRLAKRAHFDKETIYTILDTALFFTIFYSVDIMPYSIPTAFVRYEDKLYIHVSEGSNFIREFEKTIPGRLSVILLDALIEALMDYLHSVYYMSGTLFAT